MTVTSDRVRNIFKGLEDGDGACRGLPRFLTCRELAMNDQLSREMGPSKLPASCELNPPTVSNLFMWMAN